MVVVEERKAFHHPRIEPIARVPGNLSDDVKPIAQPLQLAARGRWEDRDLAIFTLVPVLRYGVTGVLETSCSVV